MADNVAITAGAGTTIATDDDGVAHHQYVKLEFGADNVYTKVDATNPLPVRPTPDVLQISVASAGLTNVTYAAGDQLGNIYTLPNAARVSGGYGYITKVMLIDANDSLGACDVIFFDRSVTLAADNAAFAISDADALFIEGLVSLPSIDIGNNRLLQALNLRIPYVCTGSTSLFAAVITRTANAAIATPTTHQLIVTVERA